MLAFVICMEWPVYTTRPDMRSEGMYRIHFASVVALGPLLYFHLPASGFTLTSWGDKTNATQRCCWRKKNIARGTTDPEIDSVTWTKFSDHIIRLF